MTQPDDIKARLYSELNKLPALHRQAAEVLVRRMLEIIAERDSGIGNARTELEAQIFDLQNRLTRIRNLSTLPNDAT